MYYTNKILYKGEELELLEISEGFSGLFGNFFKDDVTVNFKISKDYNKVWCIYKDSAHRNRVRLRVRYAKRNSQ